MMYLNYINNIRKKIMGRMKETIPENYVCTNYCEEICIECQYSMETAHIPKKWRPRIETWYNKGLKRGSK